MLLKSNEKTKKKPINKIRVAFIICTITLPLIQWLIFYVYANLSSFTMAFTDASGNPSIENFARFFNEFTMETSEIRTAFRNTFLTFGILFVAYPFKVLVSYFIYKKVPGAAVYRVLFFLPSVLFAICTSMMFTRVVGTNGFLAQWIGERMNLGYTPELLADDRFANITVLLNMLWLGFPGDLIIWGGTFSRIPEETLEAGRIDGTTWWTEFSRIIVPMVWPTVSLQMVLLFCGIFGASGNVFLLTRGAYGTMTLSAWMYITLLDGSGTNYTSNVYNYLSAVGMLLTVVAVAIALIVRKFTDKMFDEVEF